MKKFQYPEFAGALQQKSSVYIRKRNEIRDGANIDFGDVVGAMKRRKGAQSTEADMPKLPVDNNTLGAFIARFTTGPEIWAANNAADDLTSVLKRWTGPDPDDWTDVRTGMIADAEVNIVDDLDEVWVSSYDRTNDVIGDPFTVDSAHSVSTTRQLEFAPKGRFYMEFGGSMWAINVSVGGVRFRDRAYKSSGAAGAISFARAPQTVTQTAALQTEFATGLELDSVRYIKAGQQIEIYDAGTSTLLYELTVASVDTAEDTAFFGTPDTLTFTNAEVNTGTDVITVASNTWMTTGKPVTFWHGGTAPTPLVNTTVYYIIRLSATTIKLATSRANALAGTAIDLTAAGSGTFRLTFTIVVGNKDEIWKAGRKGKLTRFWNTDYRNPEASDWIKIPATFDAQNDISAAGKIAGRFFIFTENSMCRVAGTQTGQTPNMIVLRNDVGCIAHRSICYYDNFMVWLDAKGQIWIRNEEAGEQDVISEAIATTMARVPQENLRDASAVSVGKKYKLTLGVVDGRTLRVVYDFRTNQWTQEWFVPQMPVQLEYTYDGTIKPHFFDHTGQMWVDEQGDDDNGTVIPFEAELGDDDFGVDELKEFKGIKVWGVNLAATKIMASFDRGEFIDVAQLSKNVESVAIKMPQHQPRATTINIKFVNSSSGDPVQIDKATIYYNVVEDTFRETK